MRALIPIFMLAAGCATDITRHGYPVELVPDHGAPSLRVTEAVPLDLAAGRADQPLEAGARWDPVGTIPDGVVYRSHEDLLQVHTGHAYEAWIVVRDGWLMGVYLPVQDLYLELDSPRTLPMEILP